MGRGVLLLVLGMGVGVLAIGACAKSAVLDDDAGTDDGGGGADQASQCPQYDLTKDPKHCGSCTKSCNVDQICSNGACKAECDPPTTKCVGDAGGCFDLQSDLQHCGMNKCTVPDGGGMDPGTNNPDSGIDGGPDASSTGWTPGMATCKMGTCGLQCPGGFTACSDQLCYDLQNHHENCGMCGTACQSTEWCTQGKCCATGTMVCGGNCVDVMSDDNNCGVCGKVCGNGLHCSSGICQACGGYAAINSCWYLSALSQSCNSVCQSHGGLDTVNGKHSGNPICMHFYPNKANGSNWMTVECCSTDNNTDWGANGQAVDGTFSHSACYLACPCKT